MNGQKKRDSRSGKIWDHAILFGLGAPASKSVNLSFRAYLSSQRSDNQAQLAVASRIDLVSLTMPGLAIGDFVVGLKDQPLGEDIVGNHDDDIVQNLNDQLLNCGVKA